MNILIIYTNWRRRYNLYDIVSKCKKQTIIPKIVIIDNASLDENNRYVNDDESIEVIKKNNELMCWERWMTSFNYDSKYLCIMDDDLIFKNDFVLDKCVEYMDRETHIDCIGPEGVVFVKNQSYFGSKHYLCNTDKDINVSIIKGRFMFLRRSSLDGLNLKPDLTCDDIKVSSHLKTKVLPSVLFDCFEDLHQGNESLSLKQYQRNAREFAKQKYFKEN
jgi:hypothetical protein